MKALAKAGDLGHSLDRDGAFLDAAAKTTLAASTSIPSSSTRRIRPTPSTCPGTMCLPSGSPARSAGSTSTPPPSRDGRAWNCEASPAPRRGPPTVGDLHRGEADPRERDRVSEGAAAAVSGARTTRRTDPPRSSTASTRRFWHYPGKTARVEGLWMYPVSRSRADRSASSPARETRPPARLSSAGPSPASVGATKRRACPPDPLAKARACERRAPSRRSDGRLRRPAASRFAAGRGRLQLRAFRKRPLPKASLRGWRRPRRAASSGANRPARCPSDGDRIRGRAELVHAATALLPGHPAGLRNHDAPVQRNGRLVGDERAAGGDPVRQASFCRRARRPGSAVQELDVHPSSRRPAKPWPSVFGLGSGAPTTTRATPAATIASTQGGVRAVVGAGLERDVERRASRSLARGLERDELGVRASRPLVPPLAYDLVTGNHHGSDDGIRVRRASSGAAPAQRALNGFGKAFTSCR